MKSLISFLFVSLLIIGVGCDSTTEPIKEKLSQSSDCQLKTLICKFSL